jgi:aspartyl protease family protein
MSGAGNVAKSAVLMIGAAFAISAFAAKSGLFTASQPTRVASATPVAPSVPTPKPAMPVGNIAYLYAQPNGHFMAELQVRGTTIRTMVDTGASVIALSYEDAEKIGRRPLPNDRTARFNTANGTVIAHLVRLQEVRLQGITLYDVDAAIMPKGAMNGTLLGMSFMRRLSGVETRGATMIMRQ